MKHNLKLSAQALSLSLSLICCLCFNFSAVSAQTFVRKCGYPYASTTNVTMQTFTSSDCAALNVGSTVKLTDTRNGQVYRIRKFADNHCWMIDNMKIAGTTITSADSNVTANVTLPAAATSGNSNNTTIQIWDGSAQTYCANSNNFADDSTTLCGYHYNWMGATAGTGAAAMVNADAPASICPKGWRLPPNTGDGSFLNLANAAGFTNNAAGSAALQNDTTGFSGRFTGFYGSAWGYVGLYGHYWSRSASSAANAYTLNFGTEGYVNPQKGDFRHTAFSVRCVL